MKASEMTNEELTECIESARLAPEKYVLKDDLICYIEAIRETAARLRNQGKIIKMAHVQTRIAAKLRTALKVSADCAWCEREYGNDSNNNNTKGNK